MAASKVSCERPTVESVQTSLIGEWPRWQAASVLGAYAIIFWALRVDYWANTSEAPFSDIASYVAVGQQIAHHFFFGLTETNYSFYTPVTPGIIAVAILIGGENYQTVFRFLVQGLTFFGTFLLAYEIVKMTGRRWLGISLLFIVALARPSIFWSLKLGTEAVSEALLILSLGMSLQAMRTRSLAAAFLAGVLCLLLGLNRPQFLPSTFLVAACFGLRAFGIRRVEPMASAQDATQGQAPGFLRRCGRWTISFRGSRTLWQACYFAVGIIAVWSPWIVRNYVHYGAFIPTSTNGTGAFTWEYGSGPIRTGRYKELISRNGTNGEFNPDEIQKTLSNSANDYEESRIMLRWAKAWLFANRSDLPRLFVWRLKHFVSQNGASGLTKVPRDRLFARPTVGFNNPYPPVSWLDLILLDKTPWVCFLAFAGVMLLIMRYGLFGLIVASLLVTPWFVLAALIGYERYVESMISITLWLALYCSVQGIAYLSTQRCMTKSPTDPPCRT